jgi:hypothetical protein
VAARHGDDALVTREVVRRESKGDRLVPVVAECQPDHGRGARLIAPLSTVNAVAADGR